MDVLTFNLGKDRRNLVSDIKQLDFTDSKYEWIQARQYENQMRQAEVHVLQGNGKPFDLTGSNYVFEGLLPDGIHRVIDADCGVALDPKGGVFRFDFPAPVFAMAGSYKQAFFRIMKDGKNIATLEFSMEVMADKVIDGLVPADYITPFEDLYNKLEDIVNGADGRFNDELEEMKRLVAGLISSTNFDIKTLLDQVKKLQNMLDALDAQIKAGDILSKADVKDFQQQAIFPKGKYALATCDKGVDFGEFLKSDKVPIGMSLVRDNNTTNNATVVKESADYIRATSVASNGLFSIFTMVKGVASGWITLGPYLEYSRPTYIQEVDLNDYITPDVIYAGADVKNRPFVGQYGRVEIKDVGTRIGQTYWSDTGNGLAHRTYDKNTKIWSDWKDEATTDTVYTKTEVDKLLPETVGWSKEGITVSNAKFGSGSGYVVVNLSEHLQLIFLEVNLTNVIADDPIITIPTSISANWNGVVKANDMASGAAPTLTAQMNGSSGKLTVWCSKSFIKDANSSLNVSAIWLKIL